MSTNNFEDHPAVRLLRGFFAEMNAWEVAAMEQYTHTRDATISATEKTQLRAQQRLQMEAIFEKYCDIGRQATRLQDHGLSFGDPPTYTPNGEAIISLSKKGNKLIIETKQNHPPGWKYWYEVVQVDGQWRLRDIRKSSTMKNPTWRKVML